jgi:hypothetical protein
MTSKLKFIVGGVYECGTPSDYYYTKFRVLEVVEDWHCKFEPIKVNKVSYSVMDYFYFNSTMWDESKPVNETLVKQDVEEWLK